MKRDIGFKGYEKTQASLDKMNMEKSRRKLKKFVSTNRSRETADREASIQMKYLQDPIKLAQFVRERLRDNNLELVQTVVNKASARMSCVVSWNHIIEWHLENGKMNGALKMYNEVCLAA